MKQQSQRVLDACISTIQFNTNNPMNPAVPRVTALQAELITTTDALRDYGAAQINHHSAFRGAVDNRVFVREQTLKEMRKLNKIARALDKVAFPQVREHFRMPRSRSNANVAAAARSFATHGEAMEAVFTERGRPATFAADLRALATELDAAADPREAERQEQVGATAGITATTREAVAILRELDAIITPLVESDPVLLATWKSAVDIEDAPQRQQPKEEEPEFPPGSGSMAAAGDPVMAGEGGGAA